MTNYFWPVYKNIEHEITALSYDIHIDDGQLGVYSAKIADLILRASAEIESISKELYKKNGGAKTNNISYDADALLHLNELWNFQSKVILISSPNCFQSNKEIKPFEKTEVKTSNGKLTFSWNNSYQNLKHDRVNSVVKFGSLKYLFDIMAALYALNIYFKDENIVLEKDANASNFPINMGSEIFSLKIHKSKGYDRDGLYMKNADFEECIYLIKMTDESLQNFRQQSENAHIKQVEYFNEHPKLKEYLKLNSIEDYKGQNIIWDVLGREEYVKMLQITTREQMKSLEKTKYEAILNKTPL